MFDFLKKQNTAICENKASSLSALNKKQKGQKGEQIAQQFLLDNGLKLIKQNFYSRFGEVDLIMHESIPRKTDYLVFIEVRFRKNSGYGSALESIDSFKQQKLKKTAEYFLLKNSKYQVWQPRFDVVVIPPENSRDEINWLKNAF